MSPHEEACAKELDRRRRHARQLAADRLRCLVGGAIDLLAAELPDPYDRPLLRFRAAFKILKVPDLKPARAGEWRNPVGRASGVSANVAPDASGGHFMEFGPMKLMARRRV